MHYTVFECLIDSSPRNADPAVMMTHPCSCWPLPQGRTGCSPR